MMNKEPYPLGLNEKKCYYGRNDGECCTECDCPIIKVGAGEPVPLVEDKKGAE